MRAIVFFLAWIVFSFSPSHGAVTTDNFDYMLDLIYNSSVNYTQRRSYLITSLTNIVVNHSTMTNGTNFMINPTFVTSSAISSHHNLTITVLGKDNKTLNMIEMNVTKGAGQQQILTTLNLSLIAIKYSHKTPKIPQLPPLPLEFITGWIWLAMVGPGLCVSSCWLTMLTLHCAPESAKVLKKEKDIPDPQRIVEARTLNQRDLFHKMQSKKNLVDDHQAQLKAFVVSNDDKNRIRNSSSDKSLVPSSQTNLSSVASNSALSQSASNPVPVTPPPVPRAQSNSNDDLYESGHASNEDLRSPLNKLGYQEPANHAQAMVEADIYRYYSEQNGWKNSFWHHHVKRNSQEYLPQQLHPEHHPHNSSHHSLSPQPNPSLASGASGSFLDAEVVQAARAAGVSIDLSAHHPSQGSSYGGYSDHMADMLQAEEAHMVAQETVIAAMEAGVPVYREDVEAMHQMGQMEHSRSHSSDLFAHDQNSYFDGGPGVFS